MEIKTNQIYQFILDPNCILDILIQYDIRYVNPLVSPSVIKIVTDYIELSEKTDGKK